MADPRDHLLRQIAELRSRVDAEVLDLAGRAAKAYSKGPGPAPPPKVPDDAVPYDREAARTAVQLFLADRHDGGRFKKLLLDRLQREQRIRR